jgi:hypothetical protein
MVSVDEAGRARSAVFRGITDHPPPEVAIAGHDRCIMPLKPEDRSAWLSPEGRTLEELEAILDDRVKPYYVYRLAASRLVAVDRRLGHSHQLLVASDLTRCISDSRPFESGSEMDSIFHLKRSLSGSLSKFLIIPK